MKRIRWSLVVLAALFSFVSAPEALAQTPRFVHPDGDNELGDGLTWETAWETLTKALDALNASGEPEFDEIWIAMGGPGFVYIPGATETDTFLISNPVAIYGGFEGGEDELDDRTYEARTTLSGELGNANFHHIVTLGSSLDGEVLFDGVRFSDGSRVDQQNGGGGAIHAVASSGSGVLKLFNCDFEHNWGWQNGGAIRCENRSLIVRRCNFVDNTAQGKPAIPAKVPNPGVPEVPAFGGAIKHGGGDLEISLSKFHENYAWPPYGGNTQLEGGAVYSSIGSGQHIYIINCVFQGNWAQVHPFEDGLGGAISAHLSSGTAVAHIGNCMFHGNESGQFGGAVYANGVIEIAECTITKNYATDDGGGIFVNGSNASVQNCILWKNGIGLQGSETYPFHAQVEVDGGTLALAYSCVEDYSGSVTTNTAADPLFVNWYGGNYGLKSCSPALNSGSNDLLSDDLLDIDDESETEDHPLDLIGGARVQNSVLDMGAYERTCPADLDGSGGVDGADLGILLGAWGACVDCDSDLDCSDVVDGADLGALLGAWGPCPSGSMSFGGGGGESLAALMSYFGVDSVEDLVNELSKLDFEDMQTLLQTFLGG